MNPVPVMQLVEVARGVHTSQQTFEACKGLAEFLGKQVCTSQDRPVSRRAGGGRLGLGGGREGRGGAGGVHGEAGLHQPGPPGERPGAGAGAGAEGRAAGVQQFRGARPRVQRRRRRALPSLLPLPPCPGHTPWPHPPGPAPPPQPPAPPLPPQGFLVNRVLIPMINEAFFCLMEVGGGRVAGAQGSGGADAEREGAERAHGARPRSVPARAPGSRRWPRAPFSAGVGGTAATGPPPQPPARLPPPTPPPHPRASAPRRTSTRACGWAPTSPWGRCGWRTSSVRGRNGRGRF
jgi:hypothetical protein